MHNVDSDRLQTFLMQALHSIAAITQFDKLHNAVVNGRTKLPLCYWWQMWLIIWSHLSPTAEDTCLTTYATVNRSQRRHTSHCWLQATTRYATEKLATAIATRHWPILWCCLDIAEDHLMCRTLPHSVDQPQQSESKWVRITTAHGLCECHI